MVARKSCVSFSFSLTIFMWAAFQILEIFGEKPVAGEEAGFDHNTPVP